MSGKLKSLEQIRVEPARKQIKPNEIILIELELHQHDLPMFYDREIEFYITWIDNITDLSTPGNSVFKQSPKISSESCQLEALKSEEQNVFLRVRKSKNLEVI